MDTIRGLSTGIGSLPFKDAGQALDAILSCCPEVPFWPQLPRRDLREGMLSQFCEGFPCLRVSGADVLYDPSDEENAYELFYERIIQQDTDYFAISPAYSSGIHAFRTRLSREPDALGRARYLKGHIVGPLTFCAGIKDAQGKAALHNEVFVQAAVQGLVMKGLWQASFLKEVGKQVIVFLDEPFLAAFGSAYTAVTRETVMRVLSETTAALKEKGISTGVHCCGNTDWSLFTAISSLDIINFDAYGFLDKVLLYASDLRAFLGRGGVLCWGIVPTQEFSREETSALQLKERIDAAIEALGAKGIDTELVRQRMMISPSCGLGSLDPEKAGEILLELRATSSLLRG
jgi:methionine synthase II (cobalamin-independent)